MDILECVHLKLRYCCLIWRHVQLRLSYEYHWTKHNEVPVLSITRHRRCPLFLEADCILVDQILLDSSTHLLPPSSRDLRHLRFRLQNGEKTFNFQAPDEVTYEMWRVVIVDAISETAEMEQRLQSASTIDIDVGKAVKDGDVMRQLDHDQAKVYVRDTTNGKLVRLHQPAAAHRNLEQTLDGIQYEITTTATVKKTIMFSWLLDAVKHEYPVVLHYKILTSSEEVDATVSENVAAFDPLFDTSFGHLVDAVVHQYKFPDNQEPSVSNVSSHTATISEDHDCEQSSASTATRISSDGEEDVLDLFTPMQTEVYHHTVFATSSIKQRSGFRKPTARETLRRRLMETDATKHGMFPCHSTPTQPEEELDGTFDTRFTVHPYLNFA